VCILHTGSRAQNARGIRAGSTNLRAGSPRSPQTPRSRKPFTMNARLNNLLFAIAAGAADYD
jgi:hypothetical protein